MAARWQPPRAPPVLRDGVQHIDDDGFRIAEILVAKLRFQRLYHGSLQVNEWFAADAAGFTEAFRCYHREVPPTTFDVRGEAEAFARWLRGRGLREFR